MLRQVPPQSLLDSVSNGSAPLLPEGPRLAALVRGAKTSPDDLLTLLMTAGSDSG